jgi:hypothetical protein
VMTHAEIQEIIVSRLDAINGSCNSAHLDHTDGILRGLLWVLIGKDPGTYLLRDTASLCKMARISYRIDGDTVHYWLGL